MRKKVRYILIVSVGALAWVIFWMLYGHNLSFDVEAGSPGNMTYWYTEDFSLSGKIIITTFVSGFVAGIFWFFIPKKKSKL